MPTRLKSFTLGDTYGGVNRMLSPHMLGNNVAALTNNWVLRKNGIETAKGWNKFTDQVLTDGDGNEETIYLIDQFFLNDGSSELIAFTGNLVYRFNETGSDLWIPITPGRKLATFVDVTSAAAQKTLSVDSVSGYQPGDTIIINEDGAREEEGVVDSISTSGTVTPSDTTRYSDDSEDSEYDIDAYTLLKSIEITADIVGEQRFTFDMNTSYSGYTGYARIYKNGSPLGTEQSTVTETPSFEAKTEDITTNWSAGDTLELWVNTNGYEMHGVSCKNFRMKYDGGTISLTLLDNLTYEHTDAQADVVRRTYGSSVVDANSASGQKVLNVSHTDQYSTGEIVVVGLNTPDEEILTIASIQADTSLTMVEDLVNTHNAADTFAERMVCRISELSFVSVASGVDTDNTQNVYYFTDGVNAIQKWNGVFSYHQPLPGIGSVDGGATYPDVEGLGTITVDVKAKYIRAFEGFLVIGHVTEEGTTIPQKIRWSRLDGFESWVNEIDGTGQAGYATFESSDFITGMYQLKRELFIYRERSIEAMSYIGEPNIWGFRRAETGTGLVAPRALVDFGDRHMFVGPDNIWTYNGVSLVPIGDPIKDQFFAEVDPSQLGNVAAFFIEERDEVWITYSTTGSLVHDKAFTFNTIFNKWAGPRDIDGTGYGYYRKTATTSWDGATGTWDASTATWDDRTFLSNAPTNMMGNDDGLIFEVDEIATADGATLSKRYESKLTNFGFAGKKRTQRIRIGMAEHTSATANIYLGAASSAGDSVTWYGPKEFAPTDNKDPYVYFDVTSEWFQVRIDTDDYMNIRDLEIFFYPRTLK